MKCGGSTSSERIVQLRGVIRGIVLDLALPVLVVVLTIYDSKCSREVYA